MADVGDIHRFADRDKFASWTGTAPRSPPACLHKTSCRTCPDQSEEQLISGAHPT